MIAFVEKIHRRLIELVAAAPVLMAVIAVLLPVDAQALPLFARQTGQNCVACHAGGQFPELTPYGRMFKLTGYTIGDRAAVPLSAMGLITYSKVRNTSPNSGDPAADFQKNGAPIFATGSLFTGGKITENIGAFVQVSYDNYASQADDGRFKGHSSSDNIEIRYADRFIDANRDLIFGVSLNNNPSLSDPWNTAPAWMQYVPVPTPTSSQFIDGSAPFPDLGAGDHLAGLTAYMYLNKMVYAELGAYQTAKSALGFMTAGVPVADRTKLKGANNPYWRLALTREWGAHNLMVGTSGMVAHRFDDAEDTSNPDTVSRFKSAGIDAQYQYLLDPHTVTAQLAYMKLKQEHSVDFVNSAIDSGTAFDPSDTTKVLRAKLSYIYQAKYGGSLAYFNKSGSSVNFLDATPVTGNASGDVATRGLTYEAFWMPSQYVRVGAQYTAYNKFNGASDNYDGNGRSARDNNSLFFYIWGAY